VIRDLKELLRVLWADRRLEGEYRDPIDIGSLIGGLNGKPFFKGCFTQILIETDELEASRRFLGPYEGCRKL
jgi:hypothetical protein